MKQTLIILFISAVVAFSGWYFFSIATKKAADESGITARFEKYMEYKEKQAARVAEKGR